MNLPVILIGGGGHAKVLADILLMLDVKVIGFTDINYKKSTEKVLGIPCLGMDEEVLKYPSAEILLVNGLGSTERPFKRGELFHFFKKQGYSFYSLIHPSAIISSYVELGEGVQIMAGAIVHAGSKLGDNVIVNTRASVDHDCYLGAHVHLAPGVTLSGGVWIGEQTHIGTGASVIQNVKIGVNCFVAAGALVVKDIQSGKSVRGVPATQWRD